MKEYYTFWKRKETDWVHNPEIQEQEQEQEPSSTYLSFLVISSSVKYLEIAVIVYPRDLETETRSLTVNPSRVTSFEHKSTHDRVMGFFLFFFCILMSSTPCVPLDMVQCHHDTCRVENYDISNREKETKFLQHE